MPRDDAGFSAQYTDGQPDPGIWLDADDWQEAAIPVRPWVVPGYFLRGQVTVVVGPPAVSKSALMLAMAVASVLGRELHGFRPGRRCKVMLFNAEDDQNEQRRRLSAILTSFGNVLLDGGADRLAQAAQNIIRIGPTDAATLLVRDSETNELLPTKAMAAMRDAIEEHQPDILILDPLSELHSEEENDNGSMRQVIAYFRRLAREFDLALGLVHHTRKGLLTPGDMDSGRGASSVSGAARVVLTVVGMTAEEADAFGLPSGHHKHFFRVDGGKSNYAALTDAEWFERCLYQLANGDTVIVPTPWNPPQDSITVEAQALVEAAIRRGSPTGPLSIQLGNSPRSVKAALDAAGIKTGPGQKKTLQTILSAGFQQLRFRDSRRKLVGGIRSPDGLPAAQWEDEDGADAGSETDDGV